MTSRPDLLPYLLLLFFPGFPVPSCRVCLQTWLPTIPLLPVHTLHSSPQEVEAAYFSSVWSGTDVMTSSGQKNVAEVTLQVSGLSLKRFSNFCFYCPRPQLPGCRSFSCWREGIRRTEVPQPIINTQAPVHEWGAGPARPAANLVGLYE